MDMEQQLARHIINTWGEELVYSEFFEPYIDSIPALFRLYEFEQASHPAFKVFLEGCVEVIY